MDLSLQVSKQMGVKRNVAGAFPLDHTKRRWEDSHLYQKLVKLFIVDKIQCRGEWGISTHLTYLSYIRWIIYNEH